MKKIFSIACIMLSLLFVSCDTDVYHWEFLQDESEIVGLYIVDAESPSKYEIMKEIPLTRKEELFKDITSLNYHKYGWNLHTTHGLCFVIKFLNEEYDIISYYEPMHVVWNEPDKHFPTERLSETISWLKCDKNEFDQLINKYMVETGETDG